MQCCLEPPGQHCIGFLPVQCCPKSTKAFALILLGQNCAGKNPMQCCTGFFYVMLSEASRKILHRVLNCAMLFQEY